MHQRMLPLVLAVILCIQAPLGAEWPEAYQKQVEAEYEGIPLRKALEELRDDTGAPMNIHPSLNLNQKVNLMVKQAPAREVIEMLCEQLDMAYLFQNGVILLASNEKLESIKTRDFVARMTTKNYYVADLTGDIRDFKGPDISLAGGEEGGGITIEETESEGEPQSLEGIVDMIQSTVDPESWENREMGFIIKRNNTLIVRTVPENHAKIEEQLGAMRKNTFRMIEVMTKVYCGTREQVTALEGRMEGLALTADGEAALGQMELLDSVKSIGFSAQRVTANTLCQRSYIRDLTAVVNVDIGMLDPDIGYAQMGTSSDVRAIPSAEGDRVLLEMRTTFTRLREMGTKEFKDELQTSKRDDKDELRTISSKRIIETPEVDLVAARGTFRVPKDRWIPVGSGADKGNPAQQYLIMVKVRVIEN